MRQRAEKALQVGFVLVRYVFERNSHAQVGVIDHNLTFCLDTNSGGFEFHVENSSGGVRRLRFYIAAVHADVGKTNPGADVDTFYPDFGAALAFVTQAAPLIRALELLVGLDWCPLTGNLGIAGQSGRGSPGLPRRLLESPQIRDPFVGFLWHKPSECRRADSRLGNQVPEPCWSYRQTGNWRLG